MEEHEAVLNRKRKLFKIMYFRSLGVISILSAIIVVIIIRNNLIAFNDLPELPDSDKIAVLNFDNNTGDSSLDIVGKMTADWILHGITQNKLGQVISSKIIEDYSQAIEASVFNSESNVVLKEYLKPKKIITGSYFKRDDKLLFQCSILDENLINTLMSFDMVSCNPDSPLDCIEALKQRVLGYLVTENVDIIDLEETPPNFEAYQFLLEANNHESNIDEHYLNLINAAIDKDSSFFTPRIRLLEYYHNIDEFAVADSIYSQLKRIPNTNSRQSNLLDFFGALLDGDNGKAYKYYLNEYNNTPFELETNSTAMVLALQFVNRPKDLETFYSAISMQSMDFESCLYCEFRIYIMAMGLLEQNRIQEALALVEPFKNISGHSLVKEVIIRAGAITGNKAEVDRLLNDFKVRGDIDDWRILTLFAGKEFLREGENSKAADYFSSLIEDISYGPLSEKDKTLLAKAYYYSGEYIKAESIYQDSEPDLYNLDDLSLYAIALNRNGKIEKARAILDTLEARSNSYQFGNVDYHVAQYYAAIGNEEEAFKRLLKSVAAGKRYTPDAFKYDLHFSDLVNDPNFERILNFWHY